MKLCVMWFYWFECKWFCSGYMFWMQMILQWINVLNAVDKCFEIMYGYMLYIILFQYSLWLTSSSSPHNHPHPLHPSKLLEIKVWYIILFLSLLHCSWFDVIWCITAWISFITCHCIQFWCMRDCINACVYG